MKLFHFTPSWGEAAVVMAETLDEARVTLEAEKTPVKKRDPDEPTGSPSPMFTRNDTIDDMLNGHDYDVEVYERGQVLWTYTEEKP